MKNQFFVSVIFDSNLQVTLHPSVHAVYTLRLQQVMESSDC